MYTSVMRKAQLVGVRPESLEKIRDYMTARTEFVLNPPAGSRKGDGGILSWDAFANLLSADLFDKEERESAAREILGRVNRKLDDTFWQFNCAAEGDLVGAGQARPFGHGIAAAANMMAWKRFGDPQYLDAAKRFANILLAMHFITFNESPSPDLDTRGWCLGSTGGRDQTAQLPPWETGYAIQQFAPLLAEGQGREGFYDALWLFSHTGLAQFPKARTMKRLYTPDMQITYRTIEELPTEREFYLRLPYLAYENPWDQTMLACYQGVEPLILSLFLGGGLIASEDDRVTALVPDAAIFAPGIDKRFSVELWNPTSAPITTRLIGTVALKQNATFALSGALSGELSPVNPASEPIEVPSRQVIRVGVTRRA